MSWNNISWAGWISLELNGNVFSCFRFCHGIGGLKEWRLFEIILRTAFCILQLLFRLLLLPVRGFLQCIFEFLYVVIQSRLLFHPGGEGLFHLKLLLRRDKRYEIALPFVEFDSRPWITRAVKDAVQAVVIAIGDRVELMIVAASTTDCQPQKTASQIVDRVFDRQMLRVIIDTRPESTRIGKVACGDDSLITFFVGSAAPQVTGQLIPHEFVIRLVTVEGIHHPVAITVNLRDRIVRIIPGSVGVTDDIQPMPPPAFAVSRRSQQPFHHAGECVFSIVRKKGMHFVRRGR